MMIVLFKRILLLQCLSFIFHNPCRKLNLNIVRSLVLRCLVSISNRSRDPILDLKFLLLALYFCLQRLKAWCPIYLSLFKPLQTSHLLQGLINSLSQARIVDAALRSDVFPIRYRPLS